METLVKLVHELTDANLHVWLAITSIFIRRATSFQIWVGPTISNEALVKLRLGSGGFDAQLRRRSRGAYITDFERATKMQNELMTS